MKIWDLPQTEENAVSFFQDKGVLPKNALCERNHEMKLYFRDGVRWRCHHSSCGSKKSLRKGTWLESSRLSFLTTLRFIYSWSEEMTSVKWCKKQLDMNHNTVVDWNNYLRGVCVDVLVKREQKKIGGPEKIVEVDESFFKKRKNNTGRVLPQQCIFGGFCHETNECFLVEIPNRSLPIVLDAIKNNIKEGSVVYSDSWKDYCITEKDEANFEQFKMNHKYNLVDLDTNFYSKKIERPWGSAKWKNKKRRRTSRHNLESYFAEFMWRRGVTDPFEQILKDIVIFWNLFSNKK